MEHDKGISLVAIIVIIAVLLTGGYAIYKNSSNSDSVQPILGGDKDEHGCIGSAGYSWCEQKQKCLRIWEESCESTTQPAIKACRPTGCSGQICADEDVVSTCEWTPIYACYKTAKCEKQSDGKCGWTKTSELESCLANPPKE